MIAVAERARIHAQSALERLSSRERALVLVALGLGALLAFSTFVWRPLDRWRQKSLSQLAVADMVLARVGSAPQGHARPTAAAGEIDPTRSAAAAGLAIQSLEPEGDGVRIRIEAAPYARVITWVAGLDGQRPGRLTSLKLEKTSQPGLVNVDLLLAGPQP